MRSLEELLPKIKNHCLAIDAGDIVFSEGETPYLIRSDSTVEVSEFLEKNWQEPTVGIKMEEIHEFVKCLQKYTINLNVYETIFKELSSDFSIMIDQNKLRVNVGFRLGKRISVVMRVIKNGEPPKMEDLGIVDNYSTAYRDILQSPFGLILITGPTGSGKSMSLTSMIGEINKTQKKHIITMEDPIEFEHINNQSHIEQRELLVDIQSYQHGLKEALRQKPHIIVIGEARTGEVFDKCLELAMTGHLVFTTLHANTVIETITRIRSFYPHEKAIEVLQNLADSLVAICSQKLIPRKAGGKVLAKEVMVNTENIKDAIRKGRIDEVRGHIEIGQNRGMITLDKSLDRLFSSGIITGETFAAYATNKEFAMERTGIKFT